MSWFNAKPFVVTTYAQKVLMWSLIFKKWNSFTFSHSKMNANYAEICRVGNLEADFQPSPLVHFFLKFSQCCCGTSKIKIQRRKIKNIKSQKSLYYRNCIGQTIFGRKFNFTINIWEQNTETEKTNGFW